MDVPNVRTLMSRFPRCPGKDKTSMSQKLKSQRDIGTIGHRWLADPWLDNTRVVPAYLTFDSIV